MKHLQETGSCYARFKRCAEMADVIKLSMSDNFGHKIARETLSNTDVTSL